MDLLGSAARCLSRFSQCFPAPPRLNHSPPRTVVLPLWESLMSIFRRSVRAHRQQFRRSLRPSLKNLKIGMGPAVTQIGPLGGAVSPSVIERPTFQRDFGSSANLGSSKFGRTGVWA